MANSCKTFTCEKGRFDNYATYLEIKLGRKVQLLKLVESRNYKKLNIQSFRNGAQSISLSMCSDRNVVINERVTGLDLVIIQILYHHALLRRLRVRPKDNV